VAAKRIGKGRAPSRRTPRTSASVAHALVLLRSANIVQCSPGERFDAFVHLVRGDTLARSIALLADHHPVLRAHAAECLLTEHPEEADRIYPLLYDQEPILLQRYDGREPSSVGAFVLRQLRMARRAAPAAAAAFERAIAEGLAKRPPRDGA
jgi:hypothetical protein